MQTESVLLVEDSPDTRAYLKRILSSEGFSVEEAASGQEALSKVNGGANYRVVLLDLGLPDMEGLDLLPSLSRLKADVGTKVCVTSSRRDRSSVVNAIKAGSDDYLVKPISPDAVLAKVNGLIGKKNFDKPYFRQSSMLRGRLCNSPVRPDLFVVGISEAGVELRSTAAIEQQVQIEVSCPTLTKLTGLADPFLSRVVRTERRSHGNYLLSTQFVGVTEDILQKIRALVIKGRHFTDQDLKRLEERRSLIRDEDPFEPPRFT